MMNLLEVVSNNKMISKEMARTLIHECQDALKREPMNAQMIIVAYIGEDIDMSIVLQF